jgi:hypothetical protein
MKKTSTTLLIVFLYFSCYSQDFNTMTGDWMRIRSEYKDGRQVPSNDGSRILVRYHFTKKEVYQLMGGNTIPNTYTRTGNVLKIAPFQAFVIEEYTDKKLTLVEAEGGQPIRYYLIPIDSFQVSGKIKYPYEIINADTIYTITPGIEPIYPKGENEFMRSLMAGFTQQVGFNFTYVVQKDGTIGDISIKASTNPKLNKRLIQLVTKTSGKWIPARFRGKPINVRLRGEMSFN